MTEASLYGQPPPPPLNGISLQLANTATLLHTSDNITKPTQVAAGITHSSDLQRGRILLDRTALRALRQGRLLSQQDLADDCWRRNIRVSIATIKRAESGRAVRYRIARELARCFEVPTAALIQK
jgi:DNA-binding XRE family transcriptional regulator